MGKDELTYDKFHANYSSIYKIYANRDLKPGFTDQNMVLPLASTIEKNNSTNKTSCSYQHEAATYIGLWR
jgi:hypothetical protein